MFDNIGGKIKTLASVIAWMGIIISIITGITLMATAEELVLIGIIIAILGSFFSWIGSFLLYGFGELVENSAIIAQKPDVKDSILKGSDTVRFEGAVNRSDRRATETLRKWNGKCQMCDKENVMITAAVIIDNMGDQTPH